VSELGSAPAIVSGLLLFLALSLLGMLTGLGVLRLCGKPEDPDLRILAAPAAATIAWVLVGGVATVLGIPVKNSAPWLWTLTAILSAIGGWWVWRHLGRVPRGRRAVVAAVSGFLVASAVPWWPLFGRGLTAHIGTHNLDTAFYTAAAAYYWRLGARPPSASPYAEGFYRLVYDHWVNWIGDARIGTSVLLAQLSTLIQPGEPLLARNLLVCWLMLVMATAFGFWAVAAYRRLAKGAAGEIWPAASALLMTAVGWGAVPALVGNWDNALLVPVGPLLAGLLLDSRPTWGWGVLLGVVGVYGLYVYPEVAPLLFAVLLPMAALDPAGGWRAREAVRPFAVAAVVASILLLPGLRALWKIYKLHFSIAAQGEPGSTNRPGGIFAYGLLEHPLDPGAWWALGPDQPYVGTSMWATAAGALLMVLFVLGVGYRARDRFRGDTAGVLIAMLLAGYFVWIARYAYPAYKVLSVSTWLFGWCVTEGARAGFQAIPLDAVATRRLRWLGPSVLIASLIGAGAISMVTRLRYYFPPGIHRLQPSTRSLIELRQAGRGQPEDAVLVSLAEPFLVQPWIVYALRDSRLAVYARPPAHAPGGRPVPPDAAITAVLIPRDRAWVYQGQRPVLATQDFSVLRVDPLAFIEGIEAPNGIGADGMWLGARSVSLFVRALDPARAALVLDVSPDPSLPEPFRSRVRITVNGQEIERLVTARRRVRVDVTLSAGSQRVELGVRPGVATLASGETRPVMLRVHGIRAGTIPGGPPPRS
jgi:hypothetical protein